jgi:hypothetical protein
MSVLHHQNSGSVIQFDIFVIIVHISLETRSKRPKDVAITENKGDYKIIKK